MVAMPAGKFGKLLLAVGADPVLLFPEVEKVPPFAEVAFHSQIKSFLEVGFPGRIIRVGRILDLGMPFDRCIRDPGEINPRDFLLLGDFSEEDPVALSDGAEILLLHPTSTFTGVPSPGPSPERLINGTLDAVEGRFADHMSVISRPSSYHAIELTDEVSGSGLFVVPDDPPNFDEERLDVFL